ncbi:30S ribosomal protein S13 [Candidatus Gottesmanbacteria bacterium RIFCSPHIGHO2_01_FULL_46_14]|uniref:Small ribosomal subunit protein uS13 n=1 Tax=Candidatus Gottesmanbacteria bacterium RIFCSPHIGHO2_01_FULL_46_14 TaxID=1798380 RepID=A0A1F5ZK82_9BACT|nr:MAG: 30S ribosomal protein S13 [Candidatus Gottesmanbacteria bacterium RIFCSPHIGHO2_01_FULL_46_14]
MVRIAGVDLPASKRVDIALTYLYGIGRSNVVQILSKANIDASRRIQTLTDEEASRIAKIIEKEYMVEGDLRRAVSDNIKRLRDIGTYRGMRHARKLPARGQRTRSNARTKRGKRVTIGALKKDDRAKVAEKPAEEAKK